MQRGEVWWVDFDERRPVLLLSDEEPSGFQAIQVVAPAPTDQRLFGRLSRSNPLSANPPARLNVTLG